MAEKKSKGLIFYFTVPLIFIFLFFSVQIAQATSLYFSPSAGMFNVGDIFSVSVLVDTQDQAINFSEATINFPSQFLEVVSVSKTKSIFSLWIEEPNFSNTTGTISFGGGLFTPGFSGLAGKIIEIVFRVKKQGSATLAFSSAVVRADDGYGTDILKMTDQAKFDLLPVKMPPSIRLDTKPPKPFEIRVKEGKETTNPQPTLFFETSDEISGINYYEIIIDGKAPIKTEKPEYKIPFQDLGKHTIIVKAVDKAGNKTSAMTEIEILPIEAPVITDYPSELFPGNILSIKGIAVPEATIKVYIQKKEEEAKLEETRSDKKGRWTYINIEPVEKGVYRVWAEAVDSFGARSESSERVTIQVVPPSFIRIGKLTISYLTATVITLLILILAIILQILWLLTAIKKKKN